jgi:hypothetical protein
VLRTAAAEVRAVVTEDVTTFPAAITAVPHHVGVIYCRSRVFHRTPAGLDKIRCALTALCLNPPAGLGTGPVVWWLAEADSR